MNWLANPDYDTGGFTVDLECGDRILVAIPLHRDSGGGYAYDLIVPTEYGFDDVHGETWGDWSWNDVSHYCKVTKPK